MPFNSSLFVFMFAPLVVVLGALLPVRLANLFLLAVSVMFYAWGEPKFVVVILVSALLDHVIARGLLGASSERGSRLLLAARRPMPA